MNIEISKIKDLAVTSPLARELFKLSLKRRRGRQDTNMKRVRRLIREAGTPATSADVGALFKKLQDLGVGKIVYGRGNKPSRFLWEYNLMSVAEVALQKNGGSLKKQKATKVKLPELPQQKTSQPDKPTVTSLPEETQGRRNIVIKQNGLVIMAPVTMTAEERASISALVHDLSVA